MVYICLPASPSPLICLFILTRKKSSPLYFQCGLHQSDPWMMFLRNVLRKYLHILIIISMPMSKTILFTFLFFFRILFSSHKGIYFFSVKSLWFYSPLLLFFFVYVMDRQRSELGGHLTCINTQWIIYKFQLFGITYAKTVTGGGRPALRMLSL